MPGPKIRISTPAPTASKPPASSIPIAPPSEAELKKRIMALQKQMGIPTESEYDPLAPGGNADELWPAQPGELFTEFRIA